MATFLNRVIPAEQFLNLCRDGNTQKVIEAIKSCVNVNVVCFGRTARTALGMAAMNGHADIVNLLIEAGAEVNSASGTALMLAVENGHTEIVNILIKARADINTHLYNYGKTALMLAAENGYADIVNLLIEVGADVNACYCNYEWNANTFVAKDEYRRSVDIPTGFDVNNVGKTALMLASGNGHIDIVNALIESGADDLTDNEGTTALMYAAEYGTTEIYQAFINARADAGMTDNSGVTLAETYAADMY